MTARLRTLISELAGEVSDPDAVAHQAAFEVRCALNGSPIPFSTHSGEKLGRAYLEAWAYDELVLGASMRVIDYMENFGGFLDPEVGKLVARYIARPWPNRMKVPKHGRRKLPAVLLAAMVETREKDERRQRGKGAKARALEIVAKENGMEIEALKKAIKRLKKMGD